MKTKIWEVSFKELKEGGKTTYKVTRRRPDLFVSETRILKTKKEALIQLLAWLQ